MLWCGQPGFEDLLADELAALGWTAGATGGGWVEATPPPAPSDEHQSALGHTSAIVEQPLALPALPHAPQSEAPSALTPTAPVPELCFAHLALLDPVALSGESVNALAAALAEHFLQTSRTERFSAPWPCLFQTASGLDGLGRRAAAVEKAFFEILKKRLGRVARLAVAEHPPGVTTSRGLFVFFTDFRQLEVARTAYFGGQRRMADDPLAPSRSYLKLEEAYGLLGREPAPGETVADLGAAPGGWSYSAAKRGARVVAVDNGPLKGGALGHPLIDHQRVDAFGFRPAPGEHYDWLLCDLVEEPHHVLTDLIRPWITQRWCRFFVIILKFGRVEPLALLRTVRDPEGWLLAAAPGLRVRHLFHDREEFTIVGELSP